MKELMELTGNVRVRRPYLDRFLAKLYNNRGTFCNDWVVAKVPFIAGYDREKRKIRYHEMGF